MDYDKERRKDELDLCNQPSRDATIEKIGWHKLLFSSMIAGVIWLITQIAAEDLSSFNRITSLIGLKIDVELAILVSLLVLFAGISLSIAIIHENIGRLGDPVYLTIGRVQGYFFIALFVLISALFLGYDKEILGHFRMRTLTPKDIPLLVSMGIAIYIGVVAIVHAPYGKFRPWLGTAMRWLARVVTSAGK